MRPLFLLAVALLAFPQQQPTATFEGTVLDSVTGQPIAGAHVTITSNLYPNAPESAKVTTPPRQAPTTTSVRRDAPQTAAPVLPSITNRDVWTDAQGKFTIDGVPPVAYLVAVAAEDHVFQIYGQKTAFGGFTPVKLSPGASTELAIRLDPAANVDGTITTENRLPMPRSTVYLLSTSYSMDNGTRFSVVGEAQTDNEGKFSLKGVAAGAYRLIAGVDGPVGRTTQPVDLYTWTFYPGVSDGSLAAKIDVLPGARMNIGNLSIPKEEPRTIRGHVTDSRTGKPPATVRLSLLGRYPVDRAGRSSDEAARGVTNSYDPTTGAFEFVNVPGGRYRVDVTLPAQPNANAVVSTALNVSLDAFAFVTVNKTDINDLAFRVPSASILRTKIIATGEDLLSIFDNRTAARPQYRLTPSQPMQPATSLAFITSDEIIEMRTPLDGRYRVNLGPLGENHYTSELRLDGVPAQGNLVQIQPNTTANLEITVRRDGGLVEGNVIDNKNQPVPGVQGILLPDPLPEVIGRYYAISSNPDGKFTLRGLAPGNYRAYVWEGLGSQQIFDRELWQRTRASSTPFRIDPGARIMTNLKMIVP